MTSAGLELSIGISNEPCGKMRSMVTFVCVAGFRVMLICYRHVFDSIVSESRDIMIYHF